MQMHEANRPSRRILFGPFEVDVAAGELRKHGIRIRLQTQPFRVLEALLERPGGLISREELKAKLWSTDTFGDFDHGINKAINKIRDALGDSAQNPRFVETVSRRGYRFIADVTTAEAPADTIQSVDLEQDRNQNASAESSVMPTGLRNPSTWKILGGLVLVASALLLAWKWSRTNVHATDIRSLAVLPLENLSGDLSQEYFRRWYDRRVDHSPGRHRKVTCHLP